ncbi:hypothetical protein BJ684DRAFT_17668 [Piptocephalis cylindrospora]|uniref:Uncharacterized protein n=1 Tax=Piptocephalis cylindrospora TaxID=1907219 RepID=A0A4V1IXP4_9FUNG|nr:hypothetical protein BJ684DRAFT_17668 [Piptocephalis cylindrospora]|eukprot:RKP11769.1 hypothetical protein BJ684DRAFT_17668 [Piptocephalis cylindrospora]
MSYARIHPYQENVMETSKGKPYSIHLSPTSVSVSTSPKYPSSASLSSFSTSPPSSISSASPVLDDTSSGYSDLDEDTAEDDDEDSRDEDEKKELGTDPRMTINPQGKAPSGVQEVMRPIYPPHHPLLSPNPPQYRRTGTYLHGRERGSTMVPQSSPSPELLGTLHHLRLRNQFLSHQHARLVTDLAHVKYTVQALRTLVQQKEIMVDKLRSEAATAWDRVRDMESQCSVLLSPNEEHGDPEEESTGVIEEEEEEGDDDDESLSIPLPMESVHLVDHDGPSKPIVDISESTPSASRDSILDSLVPQCPRQPTFDSITSDMLPIDQHSGASRDSPRLPGKSHSNKGSWGKRTMRKVAKVAKAFSW